MQVRAALTPVVLAALLVVAACGGGGGAAVSTRPTVGGCRPRTRQGRLALPARPGTPKRLVIFFHGQGGETEATPANHRPWIDHLVEKRRRGRLSALRAGLRPATCSTRRSPGAARERAARAEGPPGARARLLARGGARRRVRGGREARARAGARRGRERQPGAVRRDSRTPSTCARSGRETILAVIVSQKDPHGTDGAGLLFQRLRDAGFPGGQIELNIARSHGCFTADHLAPLSSSTAARAAYWAPTDALIRIAAPPVAAPAEQRGRRARAAAASPAADRAATSCSP